MKLWYVWHEWVWKTRMKWWDVCQQQCVVTSINIIKCCQYNDYSYLTSHWIFTNQWDTFTSHWFETTINWIYVLFVEALMLRNLNYSLVIYFKSGVQNPRKNLLWHASAFRFHQFHWILTLDVSTVVWNGQTVSDPAGSSPNTTAPQHHSSWIRELLLNSQQHFQE